MSGPNEISQFDSLVMRRIAAPTPPGSGVTSYNGETGAVFGVETVNGDPGPNVVLPLGVTHWNGFDGDVFGTLKSIFDFGLSDDPAADNFFAMPQGKRVFASAAPGITNVVSDAFFETAAPSRGDVGIWMGYRAQAPAKQESQFNTDGVYNAGYVGTLIDGTSWIRARGYLTGDASTDKQTGDVYWTHQFYGANFFGNQPLSLPDAGLASGQVAYEITSLYANGAFGRVGPRDARELSGWGQEFVWGMPQRNGITPTFIGATHDEGIFDAAGDGTGIWFLFGTPSFKDITRVTGGYNSYALTSDPINGGWGLNLYAREGAIGAANPYTLAEMNHLVGLALFRGGVQFPNRDSTTEPVSAAQSAKVIWDDAKQAALLSVDGSAFNAALIENFAATIDLAAISAGTVIVPARPGFVFVPRELAALVTSVSGAFATGPTLLLKSGASLLQTNTLLTAAAFTKGATNAQAVLTAAGNGLLANTALTVDVSVAATGAGIAWTAVLALKGFWQALP